MPVPDFSPGEVLTAAAMDSIGLWLVTSTTASSGTTIDVNSCFSSTYDNYRIVISGLKYSTAAGVDVQLRTVSTLTNTGYYSSGFYAIYGNAPSLVGFGRTNGSAWVTAIVGDPNKPGAGVIDIFGPNLAEETTYIHQGTDPRTNGGGGSYTGLQDSNTQFTGFRLSGGTYTACTVSVYGFRK
jgi:hypothetical protein